MKKQTVQGLVAVVGFLAAVEFASGMLQGFYTPIYTQIADHLSISDGDLNWFEAAQLIVSALCVPLLSRLGDLIGHKQVLLLSTAVTALGSWIVAFAPSFTTFLIGWAVQGAYVVWLPIEVAIIYRLTAGTGRQGLLTRRAAAILVGVLEVSVIVAALSSGALAERLSMPALLSIPAVVVTLCFVMIWFGISDLPPTASGRLDVRGFVLITSSLALVMAGLIAVRLEGPASPIAWLLVVAGLLLLVPLTRHSRGLDEPLVDVRLLASPNQWPIQVTAFLFGFSVLGAQIPLSTFAQTPKELGYGLGVDTQTVSYLIAVYVLSMAAGAFSLPLWSRWLGARNALVLGALLVALGYALWLPLHDTVLQAMVNMGVAGAGSGMLVAALPAAAAAAAPPERTGFATGMTNGTKTVGGAIASSIFAIALASTGSIEDAEAGHASLEGYMTVWAICSVAGLVAAGLLLLAPKHVFEGAGAEEPVTV
ncbi:MFS transporter [Nocardioides daphniae]|uniref:MFS transporter n=1 Tax=Nocardioides daphniae TaxID=402297 RepID=A0A4V1CW74_9ACTN|nr:MFS transporter [Nocardioides daphniae]QCC76277.1 MFS transporter [Nocardioides daphniae]GGD08385.1 membrane transport protein [Nocardioides daphniae]